MIQSSIICIFSSYFINDISCYTTTSHPTSYFLFTATTKREVSAILTKTLCRPKKKKKGGRGKECSIPFRSRENGVAERAAGIHKTGILLLDLTLRFTLGQGASLLACLVVFISVRRQSQRLSIRALFRCHQSLVLFFTACYLGNEAQGSVPAVIVPAVIVPVGVPVLGFVKVKMA